MATVPQYEIGKVKDSAVSGGFQQIQTNSDAFGAGIAQANINQGKAISQMGEMAWDQAVKARDIQDQATLRERDNLLNAKIRELMSDDGGYLSLIGKSAVTGKDGVTTALDAYIKELSKDLEPRLIPQFNQFADQRYQTTMNSILSHNNTQLSAWNQLEKESRIVNSIQNYAANLGNDYQMGVELDLGKTEVKSQLMDQGIDFNNIQDGEQAIIDRAMLMYTTKAHEAAIDSYLAKDNYLKANEHYKDFKDEIDPTRHDEVDNQLKTHTRAGEIQTNTDQIMAEHDTLKARLDAARKLTDKSLAKDVVAELKVRENENNVIQQEIENQAEENVYEQISNGAKSRTAINPEDWDKMNGKMQATAESYFQRIEDAEDAKADEIRQEEFIAAEDHVYRLLADGIEPTVKDLAAMSGKSFYTYQKQKRIDLETAGNDIENENYDLINDLMSDGVTWSEIKNTREYKSIWDKMSGVQRNQLKAILDTRAEKRANDVQADVFESVIAMIADMEPGSDMEAVIGEDLFDQMGGLYELQVKDKIQSLQDQDASRIITQATRVENAAYSSVLKALVAGTSKDDLPEGLWDSMSGSQQSTIQGSLDADSKAAATTNLKLVQQKNYANLFQMAKANPSAFSAMDLSIYNGLISDGNYSKLLEMQANPASIDLFGTTEDHIKEALAISGYEKFDELILENTDEGRDVRRFVEKIDSMSSSHFASTGKQPNETEIKGFITTLLTDIVWNNENVDEEEALIFVTDMADAFVEVERLDGSGKTQDVYLSKIKDVDRARIVSLMNTHEITVTAQSIGELSIVPEANLNVIIKELKAEDMKVTIQDIRLIYQTTEQN